jgi:hypothetical protein
MKASHHSPENWIERPRQWRFVIFVLCGEINCKNTCRRWPDPVAPLGRRQHCDTFQRLRLNEISTKNDDHRLPPRLLQRNMSFETESVMIPIDLYLAPFVVAQRTPRLWWESLGGNPLGPRESTVMVSEKIEAMQRGVFAAQREAVHISLEVGLALALGRPVPATQTMINAPQRIAKAALQPAARRVGANIKRLARN